jgi:hypothetical protein
MKRLAPFVLGLALGGILGFLVGDSGPEASRPRAAVPGRADDDQVERIALLNKELLRARSENDELRAALESENPTPARAEPTAATERPPPTGALRVKALRADGDPLPGASVTLHRRGPKSKEEKRTEADAEGIAFFPNLTPGRWTVYVYKAGESFEANIEVRSGETSEIALSFTRGTAVIEGTVRSSDGELLADTYVNATILVDGSSRRFSTKTDEEGRYRLEKLPAGKCLVSAAVRVEGRIKSLMEWIQLADGAVVRKDFEEGAVSLFGSVHEAETGRPIAGATVRAQSPGYGSTTTDERGQWQLRNLMPGDYTIVLSKDGYGIEFLRGIEVGGVGRCLDLELRRAAELALTVTGPGGRPYQGRLYVSFRPAVEGEGTRVGTSVTTDESGRAVYRQALPGAYEILFRAEGVGSAKYHGPKLSEGRNELRIELR